MRHQPALLHRQRAQLDARFAKLRPLLEQATPPRRGWIKAIREALGMSAQQLGARLGVSQPAVANLERNEARRAATLVHLDRAARALGCRLVYAIVPDDTLEAQIDDRALGVARRKLKRVRHSMALESQAPSATLHDLQIVELAAELKRRLTSDLWNEE